MARKKFAGIDPVYSGVEVQPVTLRNTSQLISDPEAAKLTMETMILALIQRTETLGHMHFVNIDTATMAGIMQMLHRLYCGEKVHAVLTYESSSNYNVDNLMMRLDQVLSGWEQMLSGQQFILACRAYRALFEHRSNFTGSSIHISQGGAIAVAVKCGVEFNFE